MALAERYTVDRELGAGGMATVYLAHDLKHERDVAIKVLHPDLGAALGADRFLSEIKTTAKLQHPHILPLLDSGAADGLLYYVMPYVRGETLRARLDRERQLPLDDALRIAREVAGALEHAHRQGIIHRDIKPENILLQDGAAVVADFGIALAVQQAGGPRLTQTGLSLGTPQYMSPEQAMGERTIDARSDIYALGAVTYEMLAGEPPFTGASVQAIVAKVLSERPVSLGTLRDTVPPSLNDAVMRALSRSPADRPASAGQFASSLATATDTRSAERSALRTPMRPSRWRVATGVVAALALSGAAYWLGARQGTAPVTFNRTVRLTLDEGIETTPAISPDGKTLAYSSKRGGTWDVYVQRIGGRTPIVIAGDSSSDEEFPTFSPDGQRIAFSRANGVFVVEATGENVRRVSPRGFASSWSPKGDAIVYETESSRYPLAVTAVGTLEIVDVRSGAVRTVATGPDAVYQPVWSPSGERLAMVVLRNGQRDIQTVPASGGTPVRLTSDAAIDLEPEWSADGRFVYYASNRGGTMGIWRIGVNQRSGEATGSPQLVAAGAESGFEFPRVARDAGRLVFRARSLTQNPAVADLDIRQRTLSNARPLSSRAVTLAVSDVSDDGRTLALFSQEPPADLWMVDSDGRNLRQITTDGTNNRLPRFTADGRLVFYSNRTGTYQAFRMNADGSALEPLTAIAYGMITYPQLTADGRTLLFADSSLAAVEADGPWPATRAQVRRLTGAVVDGVPIAPSSYSPDGRYIVGNRRDRPRGAALAVYDRAQRRAWGLDSLAVSWYPGWLPDSRTLLAELRDGTFGLLDVVSNNVQRVSGALPGHAVGQLVVVSRDGRKVFYTVHREEANIWMLESVDERR
ncbi:protein kinase domain-containing protein [Gemmatimonas groenlandica]|uniref:non-specific serine/threonine protein kinase n=1 Tax=Gemmatimonas groenlandica TaxID=2732249 RepID=A0A6M4IT54_9BACT|nr:protein kinase [Gemmatimonas groenlandica]QJR37913.1 protein kinase [Gemmatimonas groenlandica]